MKRLYSSKFNRDELPDPTAYYANQGVELIGNGAWCDAICPFHHDTKPSLRVNKRTGAFRCMACDAHGSDVLAFHMQRCGLRFTDAVQMLNALSNATKPAVASGAVTRSIAGKKLGTEERAKEDKVRLAKAQDVWRKSAVASNTLADTYLARRGILVCPPSLRFNAALYNFTTSKKHPALIAAIQNVERQITGVQAIYLCSETAGKISGEGIKSKLIFGLARGGAVRLSHLREKLILTEGIEDGLSILQCCPDYCVWACLGTSGLISIAIPKTVQHVIIAADNDNPGITAAQKLSCRLAQEGFLTSLALPPQGKDFNDLLCGRY